MPEQNDTDRGHGNGSEHEHGDPNPGHGHDNEHRPPVIPPLEPPGRVTHPRPSHGSIEGV